MNDLSKFRKGTRVYTSDNQDFGMIERIEGNELYVNGQRITADQISRSDNNGIYLTGTMNRGTAQGNNSDVMYVPVVEERLNVGKRQVEAGEVEVRKTVEQEQVSIPVELRREEVQVEQRDTPDRPLRPGELENAFQGGTIKVPLRAEEAVVSKEAFVSEEVAINKQQVVERQQVTDTVRKERVDVDQDTLRQSNQTAANYDTTARQTTGYDTAATASTGYNTTQQSSGRTTGSTSGNYALQEGMEVVASDGDRIGRVTQVRDSDFRIDRTGKSDITVSYSSIQNVTSDQVILSTSGDQLDLL